ncbi:MAG: hypothetical protein RLO04_09860 [Limnobacter sp.]|uniref:hypothetical protein n=1 Tax=Limnobacter sp. TaxID=2003368 RepID=UPI0032EDF5A8
MKRSWLNKYLVLLLAASLAACGGGGGGDAGGNTGESGTGVDGSNGGTVLRGVASRGGPLAGVEVLAVETGSTRGARATTQADGSFALNVTGLTTPLRLFATNPRAPENFALTSLAFEDQTVANINEATHALTQAMGSAPTTARLQLLKQLLQDSLINYAGNTQGDFFSDANYKADSTGLDSVLAQVRIALAGNSILLESRANPSQRATINTAATNPTPSVLPAIAANQTIDPVQLHDLARNFGNALAVQSSSVSKLDPVTHIDYQDNDGFTAAELAEISNSIDIAVEAVEILRCFADTAETQDRCLVRMVFKFNAVEELDFGNPNFAQVEVAGKLDLIVERRSTGPDAGVLKVAGGQFRPYSAIPRLQHLVQTSVQADGSISSTNPIRTDLELNIEVANGNFDLLTAARANRSVRGALLLQTQGENTNSLLTLRRPNIGECTGVLNLVRNPTSSSDCSYQFTVGNLGNLEASSRNGRLSLGIEINNIAGARLFPFVRVKRGASVSSANIPTLNANSLRALHAYGKAMVPATALNIELSPPAGFNEVCIAANSDETSPYACVRTTRQVSIPNALLPPRLNSYVLYTTDNEGNRFVQRYSLQ